MRNSEHFSNKDAIKPDSSAWIELGLKKYPNQYSVNCWKGEPCFEGEYVKVVGGKIIAKNAQFNTAPIVPYYDETLPDGYYFGNIIKKTVDHNFFTRAMYNGKPCQFLHHQDYDFGKHERAGDCVILLDGATRKKYVRVETIEFPKEFYVFCKQYQMLENSGFIPELKELKASPNRTDQPISFFICHDRNNEKIGSICGSLDGLANRYFIFRNSPPTPEFRAWILEQLQDTIVPFLSCASNWDENHEYEQYEGYRLTSIKLKKQACDELNKKVRDMFNNFKGTKYRIDKF